MRSMDLEELTDCEIMVMKTIWGSSYVMSVQEITLKINQIYKNDWKIQTVSTFLGRLSKKGYLDMKRKGRTFEYYPKVTEEEYGNREITKCIEVWSGGKLENLVASFTKNNKLTKEEKSYIRSLIDGMD